MENCWGLLPYLWLKRHPSKYLNWLQYFTMNTTLTKWLKNGFVKHHWTLYTLRKIYKPTWETGYNFGSFRSNREVIGICWHTTPAVSTTTEVISQGLIQCSMINWEDKSSRDRNPCINGRNKLVYQYSTRDIWREGIHTVLEAYDTFFKDTPPIPTVYLTSAQANISWELVPVLYQIDI